MKRWLIILAIALLFSGCTDKMPETPDDEPVQITTPTEEPLYDDAHKVEMQTGGAVKGYDIVDRQCVRLVSIGDHHLMLSTDGITLLKTEELSPSVTVQVANLNPDTVSVRSNAVAYHDKESGSIVFLNEHLREVSELTLPREVIGDVFISADWSRIYYCTEKGVAALDAGTGISRMLLAYEAKWQGISGSLQDGTILRCIMQTSEDAVGTVAISTETGELLAEGEDVANLVGSGKQYFLKKQKENAYEYIFGIGKEQPCNFFPAGPQQLIPIPDADRVLQPVRTVYGLTLDCYQLSTGRRIASVELPDIMEVTCVGGEGDILWLVAEGTLYRWNTVKSAVEDEKVYKAYRFTREDPDEEGLQHIGDRLQTLEQHYGVKIFYWEAPLELAPWEYTFETEYIPEAYEGPVGALEYAMGQFPQDFFRKAVQWTKSGELKIVLVRGIYGGPEGYASAGGIQYNLDGEAYLALSLQDDLEQNFYHTLGHLVDARVLTTCNAYKNWDDLNPWDFKYDNDYVKNQDRTGTKYIEGDKRYFVDHYAMSFALEDRTRIFEYACMPGNEEVFASKYMQKKLKTVCSGVREAFNLPDGEYIWEQYLKK